MLSLVPHPDSPAHGIRVEAQANRSGTQLSLRYRLGGAHRVRLPLPAVSERADELWRHTCFEAFVAGEGSAYLEINLAPSTQWAAYRFDGYRHGMRPAELAAPQIGLRRDRDSLELRALIDLNEVARELDGSALDDLHWRVGLSAVIEHADKSLSYWALKHPPGKPDFHNADCFALELPESRGA